MKELETRLLAAVEDYLKGEEGYGDATLVEIDPADLSVALVESEDVEEDIDDSEKGYCPVMDLVKMSLENPGVWLPDPEAIASLATEYDA